MATRGPLLGARAWLAPSKGVSLLLLVGLVVTVLVVFVLVIGLGVSFKCVVVTSSRGPNRPVATTAASLAPEEPTSATLTTPAKTTTITTTTTTLPRHLIGNELEFGARWAASLWCSRAGPLPVIGGWLAGIGPAASGHDDDDDGLAARGANLGVAIVWARPACWLLVLGLSSVALLLVSVLALAVVQHLRPATLLAPLEDGACLAALLAAFVSLDESQVVVAAATAAASPPRAGLIIRFALCRS